MKKMKEKQNYKSPNKISKKTDENAVKSFNTPIKPENNTKFLLQGYKDVLKKTLMKNKINIPQNMTEKQLIKKFEEVIVYINFLVYLFNKRKKFFDRK